MRLRRGLLAIWTLRRPIRALEAIAAGIREQNVLLTRLADRWAPVPPAVAAGETRAETGVSFLDPEELAVAQAFVARSRQETGHDPSDEEVLIYLVDEKTVDLQARLRERDAEYARLRADRR